jgi:DNA-binding transcriptional LysR family regulator
MDQLTSMRLFVRVVQTGSFTTAARESGISQSSVSKRLAALEAKLGTRLLSRTSRKFSLTEVGCDYYERCLLILMEVDEAEAVVTSMTGNPKGVLRVSAPVSFGQRHIIPRMPDFLRAYPNVKLDIMLMDRQVDLVAEGVDVAIRIGILDDSSLVARRLGDSPRLLVASKSYLDKRGRPNHPHELKNFDCLVYSPLGTGNIWHFQHQGKKITVQVNGTFQANNSDAVRQMALAGCGIMVLPKWMSDPYIQNGELEAILTDYTPPGFPIQAVYPYNRYVPSKVRSFVSFLQQAFAGDPLLQSQP